jgi:hypothetical protein
MLLVIAGAAPYMVYLRMLLQSLPYSTGTTWEATQQVRLTLLQFFQINGPVMLLGIVGFPVFLSARSKIRRIIVVCTLVSWGIFLSPIPVYISILNVRFLSVLPTLTTACSAAVLIELVTKRFTVPLQTPLRIGIVFLILALTLPGTVAQVIARATFDHANAYIFLPNGALDAYTHVEKNVQPQETCFVIWPFNISFAALTGRRSFIVNGFSTINYQAKEQQQNIFFSDTTPLDQKAEILKSNRISCVVTYSFTTNLPMDVLTPAYKNNYMTIYRVTK